MADLALISQVPLGVTTAVQLKDLFSSVAGGNTYALKCVSGAITIGTVSTVTASSGWPLAAGEIISVDGSNVRKLWAIGGAADRLALMVLA